ncbi:MAG: hypothetical protein QM757_24010 [Paludibaculum sp.]
MKIFCLTTLQIVTLFACGLLQAQVMETFDVPGATATLPSSINSSGVITGVYRQPSAPAMSFVRNPNGIITTFGVPEAITTWAYSINPSGVITGFYDVQESQAGPAHHGFIRDGEGQFTTFDVPGAGSTVPITINASGAVAGYYLAPNGAAAFLRHQSGEIVTFSISGATATVALSINNAGEITGYYQKPEFGVGVVRSFLRSPNGAITSFDATTEAANGIVTTTPTCISAGGLITGFYGRGNELGGAHGFVRDRKGHLSPIDPPDSLEILPAAINPSGVIVGTYFDNDWVLHGFIRNNQGAIITFDGPGADVKFNGTRAVSINASGDVTGSYRTGTFTDPQSAYLGWHGFILTDKAKAGH